MPRVWLDETSSGGRRPLVWAAAFAAGTVLPVLPWRSWPAILGPLAILGLLPVQKPLRLILPPLLLGTACALAHIVSDPIPSLLNEWRSHGFEAGVTLVEIEGRILDHESLPEGREAWLVRMRRFTLPGRPPYGGRPQHPVLIRLTSPAATPPMGRAPRAGDRVQIAARIGPPRAFRNPGAFDYGNYLRARGIALVGTVKSPRLIRMVSGRGSERKALASRLRGHLVSRLESAAGGDMDATTVAFLSALLVGERDDLPAEFEERLIRAGVYHIVALSGFNVALILGLAYSLIRLLPLNPGLRRGLLIPCVLLYWEVARPSGSMSRAALMVLLWLIGGSLGRRLPGIGTLASSSVLLLAVNPSWIQDAGFQLSFAATLGILLLPWRPSPRRHPSTFTKVRGIAVIAARALAGWVLASLAVSSAALVGTALVSARHFHAVTPVALLANLIAVPLAALLLILAVLVCLAVGPAQNVAGGLLAVARELIQGLERTAAVAAACPGGSIFVLPPPVWLVLLAQSALVLLALGSSRLRRPAIAVLVLAMLWTVLAGCISHSTGSLEVIPLDVGQGDAVLVRFPDGQAMLIDAGGFARTGFDVGAKVVAPALRALGLLRVDILAITHAHRDHIGGAMSILRAFSPGAVWLGRMPDGDHEIAAIQREAERRGIPVLSPRRGVRLRIGGASLEVLNPGRGTEKSREARNDDSLVLRLTFGRQTVLLTGDMEAAIESDLIHEGRDLRSDLLKVGHHGSRTSSTGPFLAAVGPRLGVISVGAKNPWGHPDREVVRRLGEAGTWVYRTDLDGAVRFTTDGRSPWRASPLTSEDPPPLAGIRRTAGSSE